jgi:hypothetical protein
VFYLYSLAGILKGYMFNDISLYSIPPILGLQILIHLGAASMNQICRIMGFSEYQFLDVLLIRDTYLLH